jgi:hypothetical protein
LIWIKAYRADLLSPTTAEQNKPEYPISFRLCGRGSNVEVDRSYHSDLSALYCTSQVQWLESSSELALWSARKTLA